MGLIFKGGGGGVVLGWCVGVSVRVWMCVWVGVGSSPFKGTGKDVLTAQKPGTGEHIIITAPRFTRFG